MMRINKRCKVLLIVFLLQLIALLYPTVSQELVALTGTTYKFKIEGYDPIDPLRGRYLAYMINTDKVKSDLGDYTGTCYITIAQDDEGYAYLDKAVKDKPKDEDYIVSYTNQGLYYETPFDKYYVNEAIALKAETLVQDQLDECYVVVKSKSGRHIVEGLYVQEQLIEDYFK